MAKTFPCSLICFQTFLTPFKTKNRKLGYPGCSFQSSFTMGTGLSRGDYHLRLTL